MKGEYDFQALDYKVTAEMKQCYDEQGFLIVRNLLDGEEITKLTAALEHDEGIQKNSYVVNVSDDGSEKTRMCLWNHPGNDITGMVVRSEKVAGTLDQLLGGEVYHYHTKLMMKQAKGGAGGAWNWHQDYGYWYQNGCLYPDMATVFAGIDKIDQGNGCLWVVPGSHKAGRIHHDKSGGQYGADMERVEAFQKLNGTIPVELNPGDAVIFHSNLLHMSKRNTSERRRWALAMAFNRASNNPIKQHHHPRYTPLKKVANSAIKECSNNTDMTGKNFLLQTGDLKWEVEDINLN